MQYLRFTYLSCLEKIHINERFNFRLACNEAIKQMNRNGVSLLNNNQVLMRWNRIYKVNERFPHPNTNTQNGHMYVPVFLDTFPEVKESIRKWANNNLDQLNCENVQREIKTNIIPNIYRTYLDDCDSCDNPLSLEDFLYLFGLKKIGLTTVWKWMRFMNFSYDERKKVILAIIMKIKIIKRIEKNL